MNSITQDALTLSMVFIKGQQETEDNKSVDIKTIEKAVERSISFFPNLKNITEEEKIWVISELIHRFSIWTTTYTALCDTKDHVEWFTTDLKKDWKYWHRYRVWQEKKLPLTAVRSLDNVTDDILEKLESPTREGSWDRRGLVVGHVQSGKTANYTGLICKAADSGYKIIIVLAGLHNNLRSQTQMRLDEGFLGYETNPDKDKQKPIGVSEIDPTVRPNFVTTRLEKGDFNLKIARHIGITPEKRPWLFVVKKNKSVLTNLLKWLHHHVADTQDDYGNKVITKLPLLLIDDEADHASVDTGEQFFTSDNLPDAEHQPKAINSLIRQILQTFSRKAYVGYTATPFANIFIHEQGNTSKEGPDLFPSSFIINLGAPSNYIGPSKVFGRNTVTGRVGGLSTVKAIDDYCSEDGKSGWMPHKHKNGYVPDETIPDSLLEAIHSFFLSCAIRSIRNQDHLHSSMLIHVTRFNSVQEEVKNAVESTVASISQRLIRKIDHLSLLNQLKKLWENDFLPAREEMISKKLDTLPTEVETWEDIEIALERISQEIEVRMINGRATDVLDYVDSTKGLKVIAIGGDKLSRGLTLEGLCVSYFLRASKMYDTLMQMGRWFGYRTGYLDVCRLYTTFELQEWFEHITDAADELREEFDLMVANSGTPREYGLKVKSHSTLMVTSPLKMKQAKSLYLSFSGCTQETVSFINNEIVIKNNREAFDKLVETLPKPSKIEEKVFNGKINRWNGIYWDNVDWLVVTEFLENYKTHPEAIKANSAMLAEFIKKSAESIGELTNWTVAVMSGSITDADKKIKISDFSISPVKRAFKETGLRISRIISPIDEAIGLSETEWNDALSMTIAAHKAKNIIGEIPDSPTGKFIREAKSKYSAKGLLIFYIIDHKDLGPVVGFGLSFPGSKSDVKVEYKVNNVYWSEHGFND